MTLKQIAEAIKANVKAVDSGAKSWGQFSADNRALWDQVARGELNVIGTACQRRHTTVHKFLAV
jgi:hypothetical protein